MFNRRFTSLCVCLGIISRLAMAADSYTESPGAEGNGKHTVGPEYKMDPDLTDQEYPASGLGGQVVGPEVFLKEVAELIKHGYRIG